MAVTRPFIFRNVAKSKTESCMIRFFIMSIFICNIALADQLKCVTDTLYHELRGGSDKAKIKTVIEPTFNRAADLLVGGYAATGTKVETKRLNVCKTISVNGQYQWTKWNLPVSEKKAYSDAKKTAKKLLSKRYYTVTERRFFNAAYLGRLHKTNASVLELSGMVAY